MSDDGDGDIFVIGRLVRQRQFNGQFCRLEGIEEQPPSRRRVHTLRDDLGLRVKPENLRQYPNATMILDNETVIKFAEEALGSMSENFFENRRTSHTGHTKLLLEVIRCAHEDLKLPTIRCCDMDDAVTLGGGYADQISRFLRPVSEDLVCRGDGIVDFRRFGQGIPGSPSDKRWQEQIIKRFREFLLVGECEKCQVVMYEFAGWLLYDDDGEQFAD